MSFQRSFLSKLAGCLKGKEWGRRYPEISRPPSTAFAVPSQVPAVALLSIPHPGWDAGSELAYHVSHGPLTVQTSLRMLQNVQQFWNLPLPPESSKAVCRARLLGLPCCLLAWSGAACTRICKISQNRRKKARSASAPWAWLWPWAPGSRWRVWSPWSGATGPQRAPGEGKDIRTGLSGSAPGPVLGLLDHFFLRSRVAAVVQHLPASLSLCSIPRHQLSNKTNCRNALRVRHRET